MAADIITENIATIGLMNDAIVIRPISDTDSRPIFAANGMSMAIPTLLDKNFYSWLPAAEFGETAALLADTLGTAALEYPDTYSAFTEAVAAHGSVGRILLAPAGNVWPDAAVNAIPWLPDSPPDMRARHFPSIQLLDFIAYTPELPEDLDDSGISDYIENWCMENPELMICTESVMRGTIYNGWNRTLNRRVSVLAARVDFAKPWRIITNPDGSEDVAAAVPVVCSDTLFNYYETVARQTEGH